MVSFPLNIEVSSNAKNVSQDRNLFKFVSNNDICGQTLKEIKYLLPTHFSHYYNMLPKRTSRPAGHLSVVIIAHITSLKSLTRETDTSEKAFFR